MERIVIPYTTEAAWKAERVKDLTSSDISVLFNVGYQSYDQLFESKLHGKEMNIEENERMQWGKCLEPAIAQEFARRNNWTIRPKKEYIRAPSCRMGSSFDFEIIGKEDTGLLEIKNVSMDAYRGWIKGFEVEMSPYIELQVQHQMLVSGLKWCIVGALIAGCEGKLVMRRENPKVQDAILKKVDKFWKAIDEIHNS